MRKALKKAAIKSTREYITKRFIEKYDSMRNLKLVSAPLYQNDRQKFRVDDYS